MILGRAYDARSTRERVLVTATFGAVALLPDADVLGLKLGLSDDTVFGHRGYSHSLLFALTVTALTWLVARRWGTRPLFTTFLAFLAVASHGVLDAMTYRTRGIPFFWPLFDGRIAFPWRPIPPAPTGTAFVSWRGLEVAAVELVYFAPLILLAVAPGWAFWQRLFARITAWWRSVPPTLVPVPVVTRTFSARRAAVHVCAIVAVIAGSLAVAQAYLRDSRVVAWIEQSTHDSLAVSLARRSHRQARP
jgi:inner membrane protein